MCTCAVICTCVSAKYMHTYVYERVSEWVNEWMSEWANEQATWNRLIWRRRGHGEGWGVPRVRYTAHTRHTVCGVYENRMRSVWRWSIEIVYVRLCVCMYMRVYVHVGVYGESACMRVWLRLSIWTDFYIVDTKKANILRTQLVRSYTRRNVWVCVTIDACCVTTYFHV